MLITWPFNKIFFWTIDVIPSKGETKLEAEQVVMQGPMFWLNKKLSNDIENWTDEDSELFVASAHNWRARWFFPIKENFYKRIFIFKGHFYETGRQPGSLSPDELNKLVGHLEPSWFGKAIILPYTFNSILGITVIIIVLPLFAR